MSKARVGNQSGRQRREHGAKPDTAALEEALERVRNDKCECGHTREQHSPPRDSPDTPCQYKVTEESKGMQVIRKKCECPEFKLAPIEEVVADRMTDEEFKETIQKVAGRLGGAFGMLHGTFVALIQDNRDLQKRVDALEDKLKALSVRLTLRI